MLRQIALSMSNKAELLATHTPELFRAALAAAAEQLRSGEVVALPTETVYGLAANALDPAAVEKVFGKPESAERLIALRDEFAKIENWTVEKIESTLKTLSQKLGCKTGDLVHPARVGVSGRSVGPSLYHMLEVMGKQRVLARFDRMIGQLGAK